jgi:hypothetical protein
MRLKRRQPIVILLGPGNRALGAAGRVVAGINVLGEVDDLRGAYKGERVV